MGFLPVEYDVTGRPAALLGADVHTLAKAKRLVSLGARVTLFSCGMAIDPIANDVAASGVELRDESPSEATLATFAIVFASPSPMVPHARWFAWARENGRLFCALDRPEHATFVNPAAGECSGVGVRIATAGVSPALARKLRDAMVTALDDPRLARFLGLLEVRRRELSRTATENDAESERARGMRAALDGFGVEVNLVFPEWL